MFEEYLDIIQYDSSSVNIPSLESHNLISQNLSNIGGLQLNSTYSNNDHYYDGVIKCNYINSVGMLYMDISVDLGTYKREPIKTYTGHPEYYGGLLSNVTCYYDKIKQKYDYILDIYTTTGRTFNHNVIPDKTFSVIETDTLISYFEVVVDSYSNSTVVIYRIDDEFILKKYDNDYEIKEFRVSIPNMTVKKYEKKSNLIMYHCSSSSYNNFIILIDISVKFRYDIIQLDSCIKNISFIKVFNGMNDKNISFVSIDNTNIYKLSQTGQITKTINYTEYSPNISDCTDKTDIIANDSLTDIWVKTLNRCYYIRYIDYNNIPVSSIRTQALLDKKQGMFYFVMGSDGANNPYIEYYSYGKKEDVILKTLNNGINSKTISFYSSNEIKSTNIFSTGSYSLSDISKNVRPYHYKYSYMINYRGAPDYNTLFANINKMSRNVELGTRFTSASVSYMSGIFIPLIKYGNSSNTPLFSFSSLKTLYINNCKLK